MFKETVTMSHKELDRLQIIQESVSRHLTQEKLCYLVASLSASLVHRYRNEGSAGLVSRRRG